MRIRSTLAVLSVLSVLSLAACGDDDGTSTTDAGGRADTGGTTTDTGMPGTDSGGGVAGMHCNATDIFIEAVDPGTGITIFNPTDADVAVSAIGTYNFCSQPQYPPLDTIDASAVIPARGRFTFDWPSAFADTDAGGEIGLYTDFMFLNPDSLIDFVCWGTGHSPSRKPVAESDGDWVGDCAGAITGDALRRIADTDGRGASSYDPSGAAAPLACP